MKILITGKNGQLGSEFQYLEAKYQSYEFLFTDIQELDITNYKQIENFYNKSKFDIVINSAAFNDVDGSEDNHNLAFKVNSDGVGNLVKLSLKNNIKFIHISTDYVFDGLKREPYIESDKVNPQTMYGKSKLSGESKILNSKLLAIIIRTSWLYSSFGKNFVKTMVKLGLKNNSINVVNDQFGTPTYARDLAEACLEILNQNKWNPKPQVFHYSNLGRCSWYEFAKKIFEIKKINCELNPTKSEDYITKAKRPKYSVLSKEKLQKIYRTKIPRWEDSLDQCLKILQC